MPRECVTTVITPWAETNWPPIVNTKISPATPKVNARTATSDNTTIVKKGRLESLRK